MTGTDVRAAPDAALRLVAGVRTRSDASGHVLVDTPVGTVVDIGPNGYEILALFSGSRTLADALEQLKERPGGTEGFMLMAGAIWRLIETEALADPAEQVDLRTGWSDPVEHARMLHDHLRTDSFLAAIRTAVRPGDVVLDIGTGSGVLAVAAAQAGARRVYAIEASDIAEVARSVVEANAVQDRVTVLPGWSAQIDLPERADVLVAEIIGSEPLEEEILETTLDARRRLLAPGARMIPHTLSLSARPIQVPPADRRYRTIGSEAIEGWRTRYGIDFGPLLEAARRDPTNWPTRGERVATWTQMGPATELVSFDLATFGSLEVSASADLLVDRSGPVHAVAVTFSADLCEDIVLTLDPWVYAASSWSTSVWFLPEPLQLKPGSSLPVEYRRRVPGHPDGIILHRYQG